MLSRERLKWGLLASTRRVGLVCTVSEQVPACGLGEREGGISPLSHPGGHPRPGLAELVSGARQCLRGRCLVLAACPTGRAAP